MILATRRMLYAMEVHGLLHFRDADMSAVSFAMTVHGLMDHALDRDPASPRFDDIYAYIALDKLSPENARGQTDRIWTALKKLEIFPESHQDRVVGRYAGKGYKQLVIDNYIAIYKIDENKKRVYVVTIQYQGRDV